MQSEGSSYVAKSRIALLLGIMAYSLLVLPSIRDGVVEPDTLGIITTVNRVVDGGHYSSRAPGHPVNEIYIATPLALALRLFNLRLDPFAYLSYLYISGVVCLVMFFLVLKKLRTPAVTIFASLVALGVSPLFLRQTLDGQEFIGGVASVLASLLLLLMFQDGKGRKVKPLLVLSVFLAAFSTGFRPELVLVALMFPIFFAFNGRGQTGNILWAGGAFGLSMIIAWLPILVAGSIQGTYPIPHSLGDKILAAGYKLLFQVYTLPVAFLLGVSVLTSRSSARACSRENPDRLWLYWAGLAISIGLISAFVFYPTKPEFLLITVPFLLLMMVLGERKTLVATIAVATAMSVFVGLDIFENRRLVGLRLAPSEYRQMVAEKPGNRIEYLVAVSRMAASSQATIIVARFDEALLERFERDRGRTFERSSLAWAPGKVVPTLAYPTNLGNVIIYGDAMQQGGYVLNDGVMEALRAFHAKGYKVAVDRRLFTRWRYMFRMPDSGTPTRLNIDGVEVNLF